MKIDRGTTPTITYTFKVVNPADIVVALLTIRQGEEPLIEKTLSDSTRSESTLEFHLTQEDTLLLKTRPGAEMQLRYRLRDGTAHVTAITMLTPGRILKDGVI